MPPDTQPPATPRIRFRPYGPKDLPRVQELFQDDYAKQFYPTHSEAQRAAAWIDWNIRNYQEHGFGLWALERISDGIFIGDAGLTLQTVGEDEKSDLLEIGYHIALPFRGQGFATEAAAECLRWGFANTGHNVIGSIVAPSNIASLKVARRIHQHEKPVSVNDEQRILCFTRREEFFGHSG